MHIRLRSLSVVLLASSLLVVGSCRNKVKKELFEAFITERFTVEFELPIIPVALTLDSVAASGQPINVDSVIRDRTDGAFGIEDVNAVYVEELRLVLDDADSSSNIANFEKMRLSLASGDGKTVVEVCNATIPDEYASERTLPIFDDRDLKPVASGNSMTFLVGIAFRRPTQKILHGRIQFRFDVK